jgi:hypothetical protein
VATVVDYEVYRTKKLDGGLQDGCVSLVTYDDVDPVTAMARRFLVRIDSADPGSRKIITPHPQARTILDPNLEYANVICSTRLNEWLVNARERWLVSLVRPMESSKLVQRRRFHYPRR